MKKAPVSYPFPIIILILLCVASGILYFYKHQLSFNAFMFKNPDAEIGYTRQQKEPSIVSTPGAIRIPIIIYHNVRPDYPTETRSQKAFSITPELFEQQLKYLQDQGYTTISMDQLALDIKQGTTSSMKPVVLTFDDGWKDQYTYAFPLLKKYHDTAMFFIYTNPISKYPAFLTWDQIKEMDAAGMEIGSHTLSHPYLSRLSPEQMKTEVFQSKAILEQQIGKPVIHFASPYGYTSPQLVALLQEAGYETGRTTYKGSTHSEADILRLTGYLVHNTMRDFIWDIKFAP